jgi:hypothetical protein
MKTISTVENEDLKVYDFIILTTDCHLVKRMMIRTAVKISRRLNVSGRKRQRKELIRDKMIKPDPNRKQSRPSEFLIQKFWELSFLCVIKAAGRPHNMHITDIVTI